MDGLRHLDWLRLANWLNAPRIRGYLIIIACVNLAVLAWTVATAHGGVDRNGFLLGTDFLSFWAASSLSHHHGNVYDIAAHIAEQKKINFTPGEFVAFFYPPPFLLYCWPLAWLGYFQALAVWLVVTGAAYFAAVRLWLGRLPWYAFAAFPPVLLTITHGQTSFLIAALIGAGAWLVRSKPLLAGALFGLAVIKPQFGLLIPLVLVLTGEWRVIWAAAATAAMLAGITTLAFGTHIWADWLAISGPASTAMENGSIGYAKMQSPFAAAMLLGAPLKLAYGLQTLIALGVAAALAKASWRQTFSPELAAAMITGALLTTPFVLDYDFTLLAFPLALLATRPSLPWERIIGALLFVGTIVARPLGMHLGVPVMPVLLVALFGLLVRRAVKPVG